MEMEGEQQISRTQAEVWDALNDPDVLKACVPGCENVDKTSETEFKISMHARIGPVNSRFKGTITLSDVEQPRCYKLAFKGEGGAGFIKGEAGVRLMPDGEQATAIRYTCRATIGGKLAQVGSRLIDGAARKMAKDFFSNFAMEVGGRYQTTQKARPEEIAMHSPDLEPDPKSRSPSTQAEPARVEIAGTGKRRTLWTAIASRWR